MTAVIVGIIIAGLVILVVDAAAKHLWPASYTYASPAFCRRVVGLELFELGCLVVAALAARNRGESFGAIGFMALTLSAVAVSATVLVWSGFARLPDRPRTDLLLRGAVRRAAEARTISEALARHVLTHLQRDDPVGARQRERDGHVGEADKASRILLDVARPVKAAPT